jgi:hypothetical protein
MATQVPDMLMSLDLVQEWTCVAIAGAKSRPYLNKLKMYILISFFAITTVNPSILL